MSYYVYKICCDDCPDYVYVGSTKAFRERKRHHKDDYNNMKDRKLYNTIRENGGWDNWRMVILEDCGEITFTEARIKEEEHRVKLNANLKMVKCQQTEEEKKKRNKEHDKKYYENNKEQIKEYAKEYYKNNSEHLLEYMNEYNEKNKEIIKEKRSKKITCECGRTFRISDKAKHEKTLIHKKLIEEKNNI